jgi:hypothetical protein
MFVVLFAVWVTTPAGEPERLLLVFPLWMALVGLTCYAQAVDAGLMYGLGTFAFALSAVSALLLPWSGLLFGLMMTSTLTTLGLFLRGLGRDGTEGCP